MDIKINLSPEQINNQIVDAVAKSAIGEELEKQINKTVKEMTQGHKNPLEGVLKTHVQQLMINLVRDEYSESIKELIKTKLTENFVDKVVSEMWSKYMDDMDGTNHNWRA